MTAQMICSASRADRLRIDAEGTLRDAEWNPVDIEIEDISSSGFRMVAASELELGELISIGVAGLGMQPAVVVRREGQVYGCRFINAVPEYQVEQLRSPPPQIVAPLPTPTQPRPQDVPVADDRWPLGTRMVSIAGMMVLSWIIPAAIALLIF